LTGDLFRLARAHPELGLFVTDADGLLTHDIHAQSLGQTREFLGERCGLFVVALTFTYAYEQGARRRRFGSFHLVHVWLLCARRVAVVKATG
jgi:hypothetical protein